MIQSQFLSWAGNRSLFTSLTVALSIGLSPFVPVVAAQAEAHRVVHGVVFEDANTNGRRDAGEHGVAGVAVSDQVSVVMTEADGSYQLQAAAGAGVVFVSLPDGWAAPGGFWRAVKEGQGEARADFALRAQAAPKEFTFLHASDPHVSAQSLPRLQRVREITERLRPAFVLITGDLVRDALRVPEDEARGYYELLMAELARFPVPVWTVPGNHEIFGIERHQSLISPKHPLYGKKMYRHYLGPDYYSFTFGGVRFVGLDTIDVDDLWYYGHIDAAQLEWLKRDLAAVKPGTPVVTFNHIPLASAIDVLYGYTDEEPAPSLIRVGGKTQYRHVVSNTAELLALLRPLKLEIALGGHMHTRETLVYPTTDGVVRFHQAAAIVGPAKVAGLNAPSGVTLYRVRDGKVDDGTFIPLDTKPD